LGGRRQLLFVPDTHAQKRNEIARTISMRLYIHLKKNDIALGSSIGLCFSVVCNKTNK
jgi:hypothetical protein